jgi:Domain of unknown function (DUF222)
VPGRTTAPGSMTSGSAVLGRDESQGLSRSWEMDPETMMRALSEPVPWDRPGHGGPGGQEPAALDGPGDFVPDDRAAAWAQQDEQAGPDALADEFPAEWADQEAILAEEAEAWLSGRSREVPLGEAAGRVVESLPPGPDLAGWLAISSRQELQDGALPGVVASYRRLASWAQAGELAAIAELASRSALADDKIGVDDEGRPSQVPDEAIAQVSLALALTRLGASWWTDLAVALAWRLAATGAALATGEIDLARARLMAEATGMLDDDVARAVEASVLPDAGTDTTSQLRARLRRAVIAADPDGADRRRQEAERRAKVSLYPDQEGTATLVGQNLPGTRAAAAMSRINALARALKAAGVAGGMDLLRAQVLIGLLLGTLPVIPPAPGSPPDEPPSGEPPSGDPPSGGGHRDEPPGSPGAPRPADRDGAGPGNRPGGSAGPGGDPTPGRPSGPDDDVSGLSDRDMPDDDFPGDPLGGDPAWAQPQVSRQGDDDDDWMIVNPVSAASWSAFPALILPSGAGPGPGPRPEPDGAPPGSLDLTVPWMTLAGCSPEPGHLGRLGPITPVQAREVAEAAAVDPAVQWRVILTGPAGQAVAVSRIPASSARLASSPGGGSPGGGSPGNESPGRGSQARGSQARQSQAGGSQASGSKVAGRVTLIIPEDILDGPPQAGLVSGDILSAALRAARRAATEAAARAAADAAAGGGCAHTTATASYRPPPRLRDYVVARDRTCRFPSCGQPAWRGDLDHTQPWDSGGLTCSCNLGPLCRHHHMLKQHPGWHLVQVRPGAFQWATPAGRDYTCAPASYAA